MNRVPRKIIFYIVLVVMLALIWSKLRIVIFIPMSLGQALLFFGILVLVVFLVFDHLINRNRD